MSESEGSAFWDGFGEESNDYCFESGIRSINEESGYKRIRLSPDSNHQDGDADSSSVSSPLGLTLRKTPSFLSLLQSSLSKGSQSSGRLKTKMDGSGSHQSTAEKLKASNFPAVFIKIGCWERLTRHEGDLTAKLYYAKRKLVWEVLDGALKSKIEIQWSDIIAIKATTPENQPGTLEIELNQAPLFYREINPQPRKHTLWQQSSDFTGGQAPIWRRHYVTFSPGILDKHYEKLLQCDKRLLGLSQKPFPTHNSPYFDPTMFGLSQLSFNRYGSGYHTYPTISPNPSLSVVAGSSNEFVSQQATHWGQTSATLTGLSNHHQPNLVGVGEYQSYGLPSDQGTLLNQSYDELGDEGLMLLHNARNSVYSSQHLSSGQQLTVQPNHMQQPLTNSSPAFFFPANSTTGDFFNL